MKKQLGRKQTESKRMGLNTKTNLRLLKQVEPLNKPIGHADVLGNAFDKLMEGVAICDHKGDILFRNCYLGSLLEMDDFYDYESALDLLGGLAPKLSNRVSISRIKKFLKNTIARKHSGNLLFRSNRVLEYTCVPDGSNGSVWRFRDITADYYEKEKMRYQAHHDCLTGLPNRLMLHEQIVEALRYSKQTNSLVAVVYFDLIKFKWVNDTYGHNAGDELLRAVCSRMSNSVRPSDTLARVGGDEFVLLVESAESLDDIRRVCKRILQSFDLPFKVSGESIMMGTSMGVSIYPCDASSEAELIKHADAAMYHAKQKHISAVSFFGPTSDIDLRVQ